MSISTDPETPPSIPSPRLQSHSPEKWNIETPDDSPPRPISLPIHFLPASVQKAIQPSHVHHLTKELHRSTSSSPAVPEPKSRAAALMPSLENVPSPERPAKSAKRDAPVKGGEPVEYAYEYVPVVQKKEGRQNISYELKMRQQPVQARMCGVGEKSDRRPVDPTPIIQLRVIDKDADPQALRRPEPGPQGMTYMQNPYYFLFACLVGGEEDAELHVIDDGKTRFLTGTPVSSLYHLKDLDNSDAAFFVFPDLGVRKEGRYRLKLTLFEIIEQEVYYCTTTFTDVFSVFSAKKFPGMQRATDLSRTFAEQGLKIRVRKDVRKQTSAKPKRKSTHESDVDSGAESFSKRARHMSAIGPGDPRMYAHEYTYPPPQGYYYPPQGHEHMPPPPAPYAQYHRHPNPVYQGHRPSSSGQDYRRPHQSMPPAAYLQHPPHPPGHPREYHDPRFGSLAAWAGPSDRYRYNRPPSRPQSPIRDHRSPNPLSAFSPTRGQSRQGYTSPRHSRQGSAGPARYVSPERRPQSPRHRPQSPRHRQSGDWRMPALAAPLQNQPRSPRRSPGSNLPPITVPQSTSTLAPVTSPSNPTGGSGSAKEGVESTAKSESPVSTPGGTKKTNRMGLGHLMD